VGSQGRGSAGEEATTPGHQLSSLRPSPFHQGGTFSLPDTSPDKSLHFVGKQTEIGNFVVDGPIPCSASSLSPIKPTIFICVCVYTKPGNLVAAAIAKLPLNANAITSMEHWSLEIYIYTVLVPAHRSKVQYSTAREAGIHQAAARQRLSSVQRCACA